jgi:hypothetical protein
MNLFLLLGVKMASKSSKRRAHLSSLAAERSMAVILSDWADPNERCAAITICLALLVSPESVALRSTFYQKDLVGIIFPGKEVVHASFQGIELDLPPVIDRRWFKWDRESYDIEKKCMRCFRNLAESYADSTKNARVIQHSREWLALARSGGEKAAVLAILWAELQGMAVSDSNKSGELVIDWRGATQKPDRRIEASEFGVRIKLNTERIISYEYPDLKQPWPTH